MLKKNLFIMLPLALLSVMLGAAAICWFMVSSSSEAMRLENIRAILAMETPVFYRDGQEKIGVFFKDAHRQYIPYEEIPQDFVNAIVAAEDNSFFSHHGVDFHGILRALLVNLKAGKVMQGGSTLTQQTAKNLFKRKSRSFASKLKELVYAVQLEYHYPKEKILEFYVNQFYVSGNGHGLGVAARYFFDKTVAELDLLECAFIAGSVKRPNYYNPFIQENDAAAAQARERAKERTVYVLNQMVRLGMLEPARCQEQLQRDISFRKGKMQYPLNTLMDMVKKAVNTNEIIETLAQHGIDNIATSGIRIITTIDKGLQESSESILAKELSNLDVRLSGYDRRELQTRYNDIAAQGDRGPAVGVFLFGRISAKHEGKNPSVEVTFDNAAQGRIDEAGFKPMLAALAKWKAQRWSEAGQAELAGLLAELHIGDRVLVSVRGREPKGEPWLLDLEKYPELQGAVLIRQEGVIRAMVGGMDNQFFNRAVTAKRPVGSVMKPLVYTAALQLGWNAADPLNNVRDVFVFQGQPYFPRPDHESPYSRVSMSCAGAHSENLASVWLLYHLCDQLKPGEFKELAARLGLTRQDKESYEQYKARIRDRYGVIVDQDALYRAAFSRAVKEMEPDLIFSGKLHEYALLKDLHYGLRFDKFDEELQESATRDDGVDAREQRELAGEIAIRRQILTKNFLRFKRLRQELAKLQNEQTGDETPPSGRLYRNELTGAYSYDQGMPASGAWVHVSQAEQMTRLALVQHEGGDQAVADFWAAIQIGGLLSADTIDQLDSATEKEYKRLSGLLAYSEEVLHNIQDFRVTVGLRYLISLGRALGITSELNPVLSFPLGSNVISLLETTQVYEGLTNGGIFVEPQEGAAGDLAIIERIEDSDGEPIFQPEHTFKKVLDDRTALAVSGIMRNVVKFGTGRSATDSVILQGRSPEKQKELQRLNPCIPLFGKTGTANRYTNSAFAGYVPGLTSSGGLAMEHGYTVAAYVGYDDNRPMKHSGTHITGATGALPIWIKLVNALLLHANYAAGLNLSDVAFSSTVVNRRPEVELAEPELNQMRLAVSKGDGLPLPKLKQDDPDQPSPETASILTFGELNTEGEFSPLRYFQPFWQQR